MRANVCKTLLLLWWANSLWVAFFSFLVYRPQMQLGFRFFPYWRDDIALMGALQMMTLLLLAPGAVLALSLILIGRTRPAWAVTALWSGGITLFLLTDAATVFTSGSHLVHYLTYVSDILSNPEIEGLAMVGGAWGLLRPSLIVLVGVSVGLFLSYGVATRLAQHRRAAKALPVLLLLTLLLLPASQLLWSDFLVSSMVYQRLTVPLPLFPALSRSLNAHGVRIVEANHSLLSNDKVVLRNYGPEQSLQGWQVVTRLKKHPLSGSLAPDAEQEVAADLDPDSDFVALIDSAGVQRDRFQYTPASRGWAMTLPYPRDQVTELDQAVAKLQTTLRKAISHPTPADPGPRVTNRKHLVIIVAESFRRDAVSEQGTPNIAAWAKRGVMLGRHMAGANGTHFGLYSLLYSRSAVFYRRDMDAGIPAQFTETLRASGYHTAYLSSATSIGWMWMERMLNDRAFHSIEFGYLQRSATGWNSWPQKDAEFFGEIPKRLRAAKEPQLIVLRSMSTHYPYAFPKEFDLHQPSMGASQDSRVLSGATQEMLKNRYANAAAYTDHMFGEMMKELDLSQTVVIFTGDHGEAIWDDGHVSHGTKASEVQLAVPCLMVGAGVPSRALDLPTYHADILPTLLHLLEGRSIPIVGSHGLDLLEPQDRDSVAIVPVVDWPPYQLILVGPDARLRFDIASAEWFSGRRDLGVLDPNLTVSFAGNLRLDGSLAGNLPAELDFAAWNKRVDYWAKLLAQ